MFYKVCAAYTYASGKIWMILKYFWGLKTSLAQRTQLNHICTQRPEVSVRPMVHCTLHLY